MAFKGLTLNSQTAFQSTLDPDKGTDEASTFQLGTLDSRVMGRLKDDATSFAVNPSAPEEEVDVSVGQNELYYLACRYGLKGWTKVTDADGNDIAFKTASKNFVGRTYQAVQDEALSRLPQPLIAELGREIIRLNEVMLGEAKN